MGFPHPGMNPELAAKHQEFLAKQQAQMIKQNPEVGSDSVFQYDVQPQPALAQPNVFDGAGGEKLGKEALDCLKRVEDRIQSSESAQVVRARLAEQQFAPQMQQQFAPQMQQQFAPQEVFPEQAFAPEMQEEAYPGPFGFQAAEEQLEATA